MADPEEENSQIDPTLIELVEPNTLERFDVKARQVIDKRTT